MTLEKKQTRKSPARTIRAQCHDCVQCRIDSDVENCTGHIVFATGKSCSFYEYRLGKKRVPVRILRQFCLDCMGGSKEAVKECSTNDCLIHSFRFGKNPAFAGKGKSRDEMARIRELRRPLFKGIPGKIERTESR